MQKDDEEEAEEHSVKFSPTLDQLKFIEQKGLNYQWDLSIKFDQKTFCQELKAYLSQNEVANTTELA